MFLFFKLFLIGVIFCVVAGQDPSSSPVHKGGFGLASDLGRKQNDGPGTGAMKDPVGGGCPLCDSSVYTYCSDKLFHDACCCNPPPPYGNGLGTSVQCQYTDCSYLHANSCYEHNLIVTCCCYSPY